MKIQLVQSKSGLYIANPDKDLKRDVKVHLTFDNPEYQKALRLGFSVYGKPKFICVMETVGNGSVKIPRGYKQWVFELLDSKGYEYEFINQLTDHGNHSFKLSEDINLRDYQIKAIEEVNEDALICIAAGGGKTITAAGLIASKGKKVLWLTHTKDLMVQSKEVLEKVLNEEVAIIGGGKDTFRNQNVIVGMVQTLKNRPDTLKHLNATVNMVIVDEAHNAPANVMSQVLSQLSPKHLIGLTATPYRKDGKDYLLSGLFGDIIAPVDRNHLYETGKLLIPKLLPVYTDFSGTNAIKGDIALDLGGDDSQYNDLVIKLMGDEDRYKLVLNTIKEQMKDKTVLIIGDRLIYLDRLSYDLNLPIMQGITSKDERSLLINRLKNKEINGIIATTQLVKEGLDIPSLDTLFITCPMTGDKRGFDGTALEQSVGRVMRSDPFNPNKEPLVVDFVDYENGIFKNQWYSRRKVYKRLGIKVSNRKKKSMTELLNDIEF